MLLLRKLLCVMLIIVSSAASAEMFVIRKISVSGLHRISLGTVLSYLPVKEGDRIDSSQAADIIRDLYKTNFFSDVTLKRNKGDLLIHVVERSVIGSLKTTGNSKITKKDLLEVLKNVGVFEGQPLDPAILNAVQQAIIQQYYNLGLYDAKVDVVVTPEERNRVAVTINIKEGPKAKIKSIRITGNKIFSEKILLKEFSSTTTKLWSFLTNSDQYSKEKLDADLENLRSYYMDRGYLHIEIDSTKVSITPDKKGIYILINITEGPLYRLGGFSLGGNLIGKRAEILKLITLKAGDVFSRKAILDVQAKINQFLGDYGYGMPNIKVDPDINENNKKVQVSFIVDPGHRVYVRHIDFMGNYKTNDEVLRREMRLQEGSLFSLSKINESKRRLLNLGYLQDIDYKVTPASDSNNQVDLAYKVKETSAISANLQAGLSDQDGFLYGASLNDQNFLGTGKTISVGFDNSKANQAYSFGYRDPYFTANKIGFSFSGYLQRSNPSKNDLSAYTSKTYGALASFDMPLSEYSTIVFGFGAEHISLGSSVNTSQDANDFLTRYGSIYNQFKLVSRWIYSNIDRALFPTSGFANTIAIEGYGPFNSRSLEFYKADYDANWYQPLFKDFIFHANAQLGYGDGFGRTKTLPFFKNFYAGGIGSVRGFEAGTLSDRKDIYGRSLGGNIMTTASASIIVPSPMKDTVRLSVFVDVGNTYYKKYKISDLRASYGAQVEWRTPIAPLIFSLAKPLRSKPGDQLTMFQFSISAGI